MGISKHPVTYRAVGWGATCAGPGRRVNEDGYLLTPRGYPDHRVLAAVADGMGGHNAGDIASRMALQYVASRAKDDGLCEAFDHANQAVFAAAEKTHEWAGMGTTLTAALVEGMDFTLCHVGDSRAYFFPAIGDDLDLLTQDHSLLGEGDCTDQMPGQNILTRALGVSPSLEVDVVRGAASAGDMLLLCTDGVSKQLGRTDLLDILRTHPPFVVPQSILALVAAREGRDDVAVVLLQWTGFEGEMQP